MANLSELLNQFTGGQVAKPVSDQELRMAEQGINPAIVAPQATSGRIQAPAGGQNVLAEMDFSGQGRKTGRGEIVPPASMTGVQPAVPNIALPAQGMPQPGQSSPDAGFAVPAPTPNLNAPMGVDATRARVQQLFGTDAPSTLNQAITGQPSAIMAPDPQGRMRSFETPEARTQAFEQAASDFAAASAEREAGIQFRRDQPGGLNLSEPTSDRDRRGRMSMADATALTGGDRDAARALVVGSGQPRQAESALTPYQAISASQRQQEIDLKRAEGVEKKQAEQEVEQQSALTNVRATQDAYSKLEPVAREIAQLSGSAFTEGTLGWAASVLPMSTDARQIERLGKELEGTTFLQGLIEAKAKGATFGALSEREGDRILAARGKLLDPSSSNEQRISAVNSMMKTIETSMNRASSDYEKKYGGSEEKGTAPVQSGDTYSDGSNYELI